MNVRKILRRLPAALLVFGLALPALPAAAQAAGPLAVKVTQVDVSAFPKVRVYISVTDSSGAPAPVDPSRIVITEDGKTVTDRDVKPIGDSEPLTTMLVIDLSGSMAYAGKIDAAKAAALAYVDQMRPGEQAGILTFSTQFDTVQPITADTAALRQAINGLQVSHNDTAMYDALAQAVETLKPVSGRKAIIVLTDGMDNKSKTTADAVISDIGPAGLSISTIGLGDPSSGSAALAGIDETGLQSLAQRAGGSFGYANDPAALTSLYQALGRALHSEYLITYTSPATLRDGVSRSLGVSLTADIPAGTGSTSYNPGGLVPEVAQPASWPVFFGLLILLVLLVLAPAGIQWAAGWVPGAVDKLRAVQAPKAVSAPAKAPSAAKGRVKLKDSPPSAASGRIKLH